MRPGASSLSRCLFRVLVGPGRLLAACLAAAVPAAAQRSEPAPTLEIHFIDVGQGDATLITVGRQAVLVDGGRGRDFILVLADHGVDTLAAVVASHNHADHIGGLVAVVADYPIGRFYGNGRTPESGLARELEHWLALRAVPRPPPPWAPIRLGDVTITVFPSALDPGRASENNSSLGVLIERGVFRALLTGDSEQEQLMGWLEAGAAGDVDVLKAAHHGARNGLTPGWLDRTRPEVVVISVGARNGYAHPDPWALRYYGLRNRTIYRTDLHGTVTVSVDSTGRYRITTSGPVARD